MNLKKEHLKQLRSVVAVLMAVLIVVMYTMPASVVAAASQEETGSRDLSGFLKTVKITSDKESYESGDTATFTVDYVLDKDAEAQAGDILDLFVSDTAEDVEVKEPESTKKEDKVLSDVKDKGKGAY